MRQFSAAQYLAMGLCQSVGVRAFPESSVPAGFITISADYRQYVVIDSQLRK
jgi:hypothetical protein